MPEIAGQRPAPASLTRGNINDFHRPGKISQETELRGWGTWIRTKIDGVRVRYFTVERSPAQWTAKFGRMDVSEPRRDQWLEIDHKEIARGDPRRGLG
jgi:hypothetical protein